MQLVECRTADEVRELARQVARRMVAQRRRIVQPAVMLPLPVPVEAPKLTTILKTTKPRPLIPPLLRRNAIGNLVMKAVEQEYNLPPDHLMTRSNSYKVSHPRMEAVYLLHKLKDLTHLSWPALGRIFGGFDHSTMVNAVKKTVKRIAEGEGDLADRLDGLELKLRDMIARMQAGDEA